MQTISNPGQKPSKTGLGAVKNRLLIEVEYLYYEGAFVGIKKSQEQIL